MQRRIFQNFRTKIREQLSEKGFKFSYAIWKFSLETNERLKEQNIY